MKEAAFALHGHLCWLSQSNEACLLGIEVSFSCVSKIPPATLQVCLGDCIERLSEAGSLSRLGSIFSWMC